MVSELIRLPSVSSTLPQFDQSNLEVIHTLANWLEPLGFAIRILPIAGRPGKANLIATRGSGRDGLVLSGHTDTVPLDANLWSSEPFTLTEKNDIKAMQRQTCCNDRFCIVFPIFIFLG